jgi:peroxiredoxin
MRLRPDVAIFAILLAASAYVVWSQLPQDPMAPFVSKAPIGSRLPELTLLDITDQPRSLASLHGKKATVLYFWSVECPCVEAIEMRMKMTMEKYEPLGVEFVAIDSHADDGKADVIQRMADLHAPYRMLLDPESRAAREAAVTGATDVVVLDAEGRIRYRGAPDDRLMKPTVSYLNLALDAVLQGRAPVPAETKPYGCPYPGFEGECTYP